MFTKRDKRKRNAIVNYSLLKFRMMEMKVVEIGRKLNTFSQFLTDNEITFHDLTQRQNPKLRKIGSTLKQFWILEINQPTFIFL